MIQAKICSAINSVHNEYSQILGAIINICFIYLFFFCSSVTIQMWAEQLQQWVHQV